MYIRIICYKAIFLYLFLFIGNYSFANNFPINQFSVNEGLSQSLVTAIYQDEEGFLWIGTGDGLNKFDGLEFTSFKNIPEEPFSICGNTIRGIIEDPYGNLWIGTEYGLNYLNKKSGKFTCLNPAQQAVAIPFYVDSSHIFYWDSNKRIVLLNFKKKTYDFINSSVNLYKPFYYHAKLKILYALDEDNELVIVNLEQKKFQTLHLFSDQVQSIRFWKERIYITTSRSIFEIATNIKNPFPENKIVATNNSKINNSLIDPYGNFWIFYEDILQILNDEFQLIKTIKSSDIPTDFLRILTKIYPDRSGIIWAGTDGEGIFQLNYNNLKFKSHFSHIKNPQLLSSSFIKAFYEDNDENLYIGTHNGGFSILRADGTFKKIESFNNRKFTVLSINSGINEDQLIIATADGLLIYYISQDKLFEPYYVDAPESKITAISKKVGNHYYVGTESGLFSASLLDDTIVFNPKYNYFNQISSLSLSKNSGLFIFPNSGYVYFNKNGLKENLIKDPDSLLPKSISFKILFEDDQFNWLGSNYGLVRLNKEYKVLKLYGKNEGLPDLMIYGILKDKRNNLWISTNKGLSKLNIVTQKFKNYSIADGLQSYEFNSGAFLQRRNGEMVFGGVNGFNIFNPASVHNNLNIPHLALTRASVFDKEMDINQFHIDGRLLQFEWFDNTFNFEIAALEHTDPAQNKIAFKLEGLDNDWSYTKNKRNIRYTSLQPGKYKLWAKAANNDDVWSKPQIMAAFEIKEPFWQSWGFIIPVSFSLFIFLGGLIYFFTTIKYRRRLIELEKQREIGAIRDKISRDIHDDIGSGLTRITLLTELIKANSTKGTRELNDSLNKLSEHSRELATNLGEIVWTVNPVHDNINSLLAYLRNYIAGFLEDADLDYSINFPGEIHDHAINPELRRNLFMVIKEALNNIVKHAKARQVTVDLKLKEQWIFFDIQDDGIGIKADTNKFGNGLLNMQQRIEKVGGDLIIEQNIHSGTIIHIKVKIY